MVQSEAKAVKSQSEVHKEEQVAEKWGCGQKAVFGE